MPNVSEPGGLAERSDDAAPSKSLIALLRPLVRLLARDTARKTLRHGETGTTPPEPTVTP